MVEFGHCSWAPPFEGPRFALEDEELGFDLRYFGDNTCMQPDVFAELRDAARATTRIKLGTAVTNTVTRDPSAVATAMAAIQILSGGRAICGVGKGDSAVAYVGRKPQRHDEFVERSIRLRRYLRGETVTFPDFESRLEWLPEAGYSPVPLELWVTGPRSIKAAAAVADRIVLNVGVAPERIRWALGLIEEGLAESGRTRAEVQLGSAVRLYVNDDRAAAAEGLRTRVAAAAHMASLPGADLESQPDILRRTTSKLRDGYDYRLHPRQTAFAGAADENSNTRLVDAEFADWFGLGGPASYITERLAEMIAAGFDYFTFTALPREEREILATEVFPALRS
jgi:5,10-methylenetetrahydromethanopterin reductase